MVIVASARDGAAICSMAAIPQRRRHGCRSIRRRRTSCRARTGWTIRRRSSSRRFPRSSASSTRRAGAPRASTWRTGSSRATTRSPRAHSSTACGANSSAPVSRKCSTTSDRRASGRRIPNCSTGSPPSSCTLRIGRPRARTHWDVKHIVRLIVTSHTYRQSSLPDRELDGQGSGEPAARAPESVPRRRRERAGHRARRVGAADEHVRRPERRTRISPTAIWPR